VKYGFILRGKRQIIKPEKQSAEENIRAEER
jgi:hypothetical protein